MILRMPALPPSGNHFIVCGDGPLAYRIADELTSRYREQVTVIVPARRKNSGPRISALPGVRVLERPELTSEAFTAAGVGSARALALSVARRHHQLPRRPARPRVAARHPRSSSPSSTPARRALPPVLRRLHGAVRHGDGRAVLRRRRARPACARAMSGFPAARCTSPGGRTCRPRADRLRAGRRARRPGRGHPAAAPGDGPRGAGRRPGATRPDRSGMGERLVLAVANGVAARPARPPPPPAARRRRHGAVAGLEQVRRRLRGPADRC